MASTYSTNLAIELIGTGDQAGSWGNTTNTNLGTLIEQAISGYVTQAVATGTDTTITIPNGATGVARNMYIELTGTGGTNTNLIVPANKKLYFIFNNSTGAVTVKVSGQTGVSVPQGKKVVLTSNGTDVVNGLNYIADFGSNSATITTLSATSATITNLTLTSLVISNLSIASANITTLTSASATITNLINTSASITTITNSPTFSAGTANGVLYLNGSKVATSGSALTFDGTNLTASRGLKAASAGVAVSSFVDGLSVGGYDSIGFLASPGNALAIGGYRTSQWSGLEFYTSGSLQATLNSTGLGIGTASPTYKLDVSVTTNNGIRTTSSAGQQSYLGNTGGEAVTGTLNNYGFGIVTNGSIRGYFDTSGNLGIGTTSPANKLSVNSGALTTVAGFTSTGSSAYLALANSSATVFLGNDSTSGSFVFQTPSGSFSTKLTLDNAGNLGLGVTPSADWASSSYKAFVVRTSFLAGSTAPGAMVLGNNAYNDGAGWKYVATGVASYYVQNAGVHSWSYAPSGTAGNAITFTQAMTLDASGNLGVGTTSPTARVHAYSGTAMKQLTVDGTGAIKTGINFASGGTTYGQIYFDNNAPYDMSVVQQYTTGSLIFGTNSTERARIDSSGNVGIGGTANAAIRLDSVGTMPAQTTAYNIAARGTISNSTTSSFSGAYVSPTTTAAAFTLTNLFYYNADASSFGAGSTVTNQYGFIAQSNLTGATNNYGFYSNIASGSNRWNFYANGTADNYFAGNVGIADTGLTNVRLRVKGSGTGAADYTIYSENGAATPLLYIQNDGKFSTGTAANSPYNLTTASAANVFVDSLGFLYRSTSSLRYKLEVTDATHGLADVLKLRSVTYKAKNDGDTVFGGLIAEEVHDAGLTEFVAYDKEGRPDALHYGNMVALLVKAVQELSAKVVALEAR